MKIGISFAGGGVKGSYQIGSYYAFKKCHIKIKGVTGTSIGSFNAAMIAAHKEKELLAFWQNPDVAKIFGINKKFAEQLNLKKYDKEFFDLSFQEAKKILKNAGLPVEGLKQIVDNFDIEDDVRNSDIEFGLSTLRLKDAKPLDLFIEDMPKGSLTNYLLSSCYLPIFKMEKLENDSYYFDGGFYNNAPYNMLLRKNYDKVYSVELKGVGLKQIPIDSSKLVVIKPSRRLSRMLTLDSEAILNNINIGYFDTLKVLKNYDGYKYIFKKKSNNYFKRINAKVNNDIYNLAKGFVRAKNDKELVIKSLEYLMNKENETYFKVYSISKMIKKYQKRTSKSIISKYIKSLKITII